MPSLAVPISWQNSASDAAIFEKRLCLFKLLAFVDGSVLLLLRQDVAQRRGSVFEALQRIVVPGRRWGGITVLGKFRIRIISQFAANRAVGSPIDLGAFTATQELRVVRAKNSCLRTGDRRRGENAAGDTYRETDLGERPTQAQLIVERCRDLRSGVAGQHCATTAANSRS